MVEARPILRRPWALGLGRLVEVETQSEAIAERAEHALKPAMLDELRLSGDYPRLAERARRRSE